MRCEIIPLLLLKFLLLLLLKFLFLLTLALSAAVVEEARL
jgi:hypothetical protein